MQKETSEEYMERLMREFYGKTDKDEEPEAMQVGLFGDVPVSVADPPKKKRKVKKD